jgi:predicted lipoprotein with Yx(FWY)xxD motif
MKTSMYSFSLAVLLAAAPLANAADQGRQIHVTGWVVDSACAYTKGIDKPISAACARACARNGSPLVVLRDDGTIFSPMSDQTPATSQNGKLLPFAGERVTVTGKDYVRNGSHGIVIESIAKAKQ